MGICNVPRVINKPINTPLASLVIIATVLGSCLLSIEDAAGVPLRVLQTQTIIRVEMASLFYTGRI